jgi:CHAT domain-containing protein/Tfp pilus assembly protein PilF
LKRKTCLALALLLLTTALNPVVSRAQTDADKAAITKLVEQFFDAFQKKDIEGVMACWSTGSPMFADIKQFAQSDFTSSKETRFENVALSHWKIEANQASVRLHFVRKWRDARTKQPAEEDTNQDVLFVREEGGWKFHLQMDALTNLAERLDAAKSKEERAALLSEEKELVTPELLHLFVSVGVKYASEGKMDDARRLNEISFEVSGALGGASAEAQSYWFRAAIFWYQSKYAEALDDYSRALRLARESKNRRAEAIMLKNMAETLQKLHKYDEALTQFEAGAEALREIGERGREADVFRSMGIIYGSTGRYAEALSRFEASLKITREIGDKAGEAETLGNFGIVYESTGRYTEALTHYEASLKLLRETGDRVGEATILGNIGKVYGSTGKYAEAMSRLQESLRIAQEINNKRVEGSARNGIGIVYRRTARYAEALTQHEASLKIARETGDKAGEAAALNNIGNDYHSTGRYTEALTQYESSLSINREIGDRDGEADAVSNIGVVYAMTGRYAEALSWQGESLKINREIGNKSSEARSLEEIGLVYEFMGRYADALGMFEAGLKIAREIGDKSVEASALGNFGILYHATGKNAEALARYEDVLKIAQQMGERDVEAMTFNNIGNIYSSTGRYDEALSQYQAGLKIAREIGDKSSESVALGNIGIIYRASGKNDEALSQYEASLKVKLELGDREGEATARNHIGNAYLATGKYAEALAQHEASLKIEREISDRLGEATSLTSIAAVYRAQKQWQQAADTYRKAIPLIETIRTQTKEPSLQTGFFAQYTSPYYGLVESLLALGSGRDEIFAASERAKARTLVETMTGGKVDVLKSMTDAERRQEKELKANFIAASAQLNSAYSGPTPDRRVVDELTRQLNKARDAYSEFRVKLFIAHPELQVQRASYDPLALAQLSEPLFAKDPDLCLLSYMVGNDKTFLLVITGGKGVGARVNLSVYTLKDAKGRELTGDELKNALNTFRQRYTNEAGLYKQLGRDLYEALLAPAREELKGRSHVVIIPDGMLYSLPFQALIDEQGKYFIESHTVSYAPSVTALIQMMKLAEKKRRSSADIRPLFAMGRGAFPDQAQYRNLGLPKAEEQVKSIARLFGVTPWVGAEATKAKAVLEMDKARYIHFATHGELNEVAPMESAIVLGKGAGDNGMLYARELVDMDLRAELVVLSACDTGLGQQVSGEGILGLTWALFVAGTPTSVVTQWKVRDDSMNRLMLEFYRQMRLSGANGLPAISKAEALRRAQLSLMKDDAYKHPYHWASVVLVGDWRK